jgi:uncharacterized surface protein with fasciclin (FAS1) repeats
LESNNKTTGIVITVLAAIAIIGGGIWLVNSNNDETATNSANNSQTQEEQMNEETNVTKNIVTLASETSTLSTLVTAVKAAELVDTLQGEGPYTVFAPTNAAFETLPDGTLASLLLPENKEQLQSVLTYHVVPGQVMSSDLRDGQVITTVQGGTLTVKITDGMVYLVDATGNEVQVEKADVDASNGVVHIIDGVLLPQ